MLMKGSPEDVIERLRDVPARIAKAFDGRAAARLDAAPAGDGWSAGEILAHLRASNDIVATRAYMILARDNPPLPAFDERAWAAVAGYARLEILDSLQACTSRREELVAALREVAPEGWARTGQHEARGPITLLDVLAGLMEHEEEHCAQIESLFAARPS